MKRASAHRGSAGFSMVSVLVTVVVIAVGLLGLAKMQAASLSNTQIARTRSLIALQADSLASAMRGNRGFWAAGLAPASLAASGTTFASTGNVLAPPVNPDCTVAACTPVQLANYDVQAWVTNLNAQFPGYTAQVNCSTTVGVPVSCSIELSWLEKYVAINRGTAASATLQSAQPSFTLLVEP